MSLSNGLSKSGPTCLPKWFDFCLVGYAKMSKLTRKTVDHLQTVRLSVDPLSDDSSTMVQEKLYVGCRPV